MSESHKPETGLASPRLCVPSVQHGRLRKKNLRQRATLARKAIAQAAEELGAQGQHDDELLHLVREAAQLVVAARACERSDELAVAVRSLERRRAEVEQRLRELIKPVDTNPMGPADEPHSTITTLP